MCLLITGPAASLRSTLLNTAHLIGDIYQYNPDGIGAMYATDDGRLTIAKSLPRDEAEAWAFIENLPTDDRALAVHWRWRTHGDINLSQCHPYQVQGSTWLMHNGVLATGNKADPSKSDTWHFIEDYLKSVPADALHDEGMARLIGDYIGNNRFAIMSGDGRLTVINREQGVEHDDLWFSNTYAWSPSLLIPGYRSFRSQYTSQTSAFGTAFYGHGAWFREEDEDEEAGPAQLAGTVRQTAEQDAALSYDPTETTEAWVEYSVDKAFENCDPSLMAEVLDECPAQTITYIMEMYYMSGASNTHRMDTRTAEIVEAWLDYDDGRIYARVRQGQALHVAEALLYYVNSEFCGDRVEIGS